MLKIHFFVKKKRIINNKMLFLHPTSEGYGLAYVTKHNT